MQPMVLNQLCARRAEILKTWTALLWVEPVTTPMAEPHLLAHLFEQTLDRIFTRLKRPTCEPPPTPFHCSCGLSPYLAFFRTVEQTLLETLVLVHVENASELSTAKRAQDLADLRAVVRSIGNEEIALFGSVCQKRLKCWSGGQCPPSDMDARCRMDGTVTESLQ